MVRTCVWLCVIIGRTIALVARVVGQCAVGALKYIWTNKEALMVYLKETVKAGLARLPVPLEWGPPDQMTMAGNPQPSTEE